MVKLNNKGIALFITLAYALVLLALIGALLIRAVTYSNITENNIQRMRAMALAEAGINYAYWYLATDQGVWGPGLGYGKTIYPENPDDPTVAKGTPVYIWLDIDGLSGDNRRIRSSVAY